MQPTRVLITGGAGYIGSILAETLLDAGMEVTVLDRFYFGDTVQHLRSRPGFRAVEADVRTFNPAILDHIDAVCDLAALSNDPAGELNQEKTFDINYRGRARVAQLAKQHGVSRYILASSCSIYGFRDGILDEETEPNPLTAYAEANLAAERANLPLADEDFTVTVLRQATVYGLSPRMRFDLAINGMTLGAWKTGSIPVLRDGTQWRPMVHVRDTSNAFLTTLRAPRESVNGQIFNVGADDQNFQILPLAREVCEATGREFAYEWYGAPDHRSYQVSFAKIARVLAYETRFTPADAAREIVAALEGGSAVPDIRTRTVDWYKHLLEADPGALDVPARAGSPV